MPYRLTLFLLSLILVASLAHGQTKNPYSPKFQNALPGYTYQFPRDDFLYQTLDLGCGTGLSGQAFKNISCQLTGIDLSSRMIEKAKQKKIRVFILQKNIILMLCSIIVMKCLNWEGHVLIQIIEMVKLCSYYGEE